jgi:phosphoserine phosphatase RsbU/P
VQLIEHHSHGLLLAERDGTELGLDRLERDLWSWADPLPVTARPSGIDLVVRHLPYVGTTSGDFVVDDVLPDGRTFVAIGDVVGSGQDAGRVATHVSGLLADAVAAASDVADVIRPVATWLAHEPDDLLITLLALTIDAAGAIEVVAAGHPPALVVPDGAPPAFLDVDPDPPLGSEIEPALHVFRGALPDGAGLLLYTDGLVERRDASLDDGLDRLRRAVAASTLSGDALATHVLDALGCSQGAGDDIALVVLERRASSMGHHAGIG